MKRRMRWNLVLSLCASLLAISQDLRADNLDRGAQCVADLLASHAMPEVSGVTVRSLHESTWYGQKLRSWSFHEFSFTGGFYLKGQDDPDRAQCRLTFNDGEFYDAYGEQIWNLDLECVHFESGRPDLSRWVASAYDTARWSQLVSHSTHFSGSEARHVQECLGF